MEAHDVGREETETHDGGGEAEVFDVGGDAVGGGVGVYDAVFWAGRGGNCGGVSGGGVFAVVDDVIVYSGGDELVDQEGHLGWNWRGWDDLLFDPFTF